MRFDTGDLVVPVNGDLKGMVCVVKDIRYSSEKIRIYPVSDGDIQMYASPWWRILYENYVNPYYEQEPQAF